MFSFPRPDDRGVLLLGHEHGAVEALRSRLLAGWSARGLEAECLLHAHVPGEDADSVAQCVTLAHQAHPVLWVRVCGGGGEPARDGLLAAGIAHVVIGGLLPGEAGLEHAVSQAWAVIEHAQRRSSAAMGVGMAGSRWQWVCRHCDDDAACEHASLRG